MGLGTRRARLLPFLVSGFHLRLRIYDVQAHDMSAYTTRRRLYIFMMGIDLCSVAWSFAHARAPNLGWIGFKR